jgi:hypothetical protein
LITIVVLSTQYCYILHVQDIKIDNLDAELTVSVNDKTQRLLHTITVDEPTDETWCWEFSGFTHTPQTPFMLLATTTTSTNVG